MPFRAGRQNSLLLFIITAVAVVESFVFPRAFHSSSRSLELIGRAGLRLDFSPFKDPVTSVESLEDYNALLAQSSESNNIVVIKFHASFCRACKAMAPKFRQLAKQYESKPIQFAEVELFGNRDLCKALGIKRVPSVHFYSDTNKVEDFVCGPKKISLLKERLHDYDENGVSAALAHARNSLGPAEIADTTDIRKHLYGHRDTENSTPSNLSQVVDEELMTGGAMEKVSSAIATSLSGDSLQRQHNQTSTGMKS